MVSILAVVIVCALLILLKPVDGFHSLVTSNIIRRVPSTPLFAAKPPTTNSKSGKKDEVDSSQFWQGEWVCADCGYIYDREFDGGGLYFEQLPRGFVCPQCSAPRKRYAKKVGDQWGVTRDGGDLPIYAFTFAGLAIVVWFSLYYVPTM
eukprot:gene6374-6865_t